MLTKKNMPTMTTTTTTRTGTRTRTRTRSESVGRRAVVQVGPRGRCCVGPPRGRKANVESGHN